MTTYILNDERFGSEAYLVHASNDAELIADMPCIVDWANEHYESLEADDDTTREQCLAAKISETWDALNEVINVPNHPELVACYEAGKYGIYDRLSGDTLKWRENVNDLADVAA